MGRSDNFCHAIVICRQRLIDCNAEEIMDILLKNCSSSESQDSMGKLENGDITSMKPEMPEDVSGFLPFPNSLWLFLFIYPFSLILSFFPGCKMGWIQWNFELKIAKRLLDFLVIFQHSWNFVWMKFKQKFEKKGRNLW